MICEKTLRIDVEKLDDKAMIESLKHDLYQPYELPISSKDGVSSNKESMDESEPEQTSQNGGVAIKRKRAKSKKHFWTETETFYLVVGVELYGKGFWAKILKEFSTKFNNRTCINLKDKYRNLEKMPFDLVRYETKARELIDKAHLRHNMV